MVNGGRLGNTAFNLDSQIATYVDFTFGDRVVDEQRFFRPSIGWNNPVIGSFISRVLNGRPGKTIEGSRATRSAAPFNSPTAWSWKPKSTGSGSASQRTAALLCCDIHP